MSFDPLPPGIEKDIQSYAAEEHISHDEAVLRLIKTGLEARQGGGVDTNDGKGKKPGELLIGLFSGPEDSAIFDEAMEYSKRIRETTKLRDLWN